MYPTRRPTTRSLTHQQEQAGASESTDMPSSSAPHPGRGKCTGLWRNVPLVITQSHKAYMSALKPHLDRHDIAARMKHNFPTLCRVPPGTENKEIKDMQSIKDIVNEYLDGQGKDRVIDTKEIGEYTWGKDMIAEFYDDATEAQPEPATAQPEADSSTGALDADTHLQATHEQESTSEVPLTPTHTSHAANPQALMSPPGTAKPLSEADKKRLKDAIAEADSMGAVHIQKFAQMKLDKDEEAHAGNSEAADDQMEVEDAESVDMV